jgi:hypothetical protein
MNLPPPKISALPSNGQKNYKNHWSEREDELLLKEYHKNRGNLIKIVKSGVFPQKSQSQIKLRLKDIIATLDLSKEEDKQDILPL